MPQNGSHRISTRISRSEPSYKKLKMGPGYSRRKQASLAGFWWALAPCGSAPMEPHGTHMYEMPDFEGTGFVEMDFPLRDLTCEFLGNRTDRTARGVRLPVGRPLCLPRPVAVQWGLPAQTALLLDCDSAPHAQSWSKWLVSKARGWYLG